MAQPVRGTQSLVEQMGWVLGRPLLTAMEVGWRWLVGLPVLAVCWIEVQRILRALPLESAGLTGINPQDPWVAVAQLDHAWQLYKPELAAVLGWLVPVAAVAWVVISGAGRSFVLWRLASASGHRARMRALELMGMMTLQAAWLVVMGAMVGAWTWAMQWAGATYIGAGSMAGGEPDLVGYSMWAIFLSLGAYTAWALVSWPVGIAPVVMVMEECSAGQALWRSMRLGKAFTSKVVEINLVMGIVTLALIVLAMVLSAAPLPFSDQLGPDALHVLWAVAAVAYLIASDFFQVVRLKSFMEFWALHAADAR
jgi:uncharacterized protein (DUF697 family)